MFDGVDQVGSRLGGKDRVRDVEDFGDVVEKGPEVES